MKYKLIQLGYVALGWGETVEECRKMAEESGFDIEEKDLKFFHHKQFNHGDCCIIDENSTMWNDYK